METKMHINDSKSKIWSLFTQTTACIIACLSGIILIGIILFILTRSIQAFNFYGFKAILGTLNFDITSNESVSFWTPFAATIVTSFLALLIATPIGIKTAVFLKFRVTKDLQKILRIAIETLAGIPSVIFGLFAAQSFKTLVNLIGVSSYSILNASIMLSFMVLPTIMAMTYNSLQNVDDTLLSHTIALGTTKTKAIYKVYKKAAKNGIIVGVILATGRAIGETMALSMLLQSENNYESVLNSGNLIEVLTSNIKTISVVIATNMFTENSTENTKSLLFAYGFILFIFIMILNLIVLYLTRQKKKHKIPKYLLLINEKWKLISYYVFTIFEFIFFPLRRNASLKTENDIFMYISQRNKTYKLKNFYTYYKLFWEVVCMFICFWFLGWLTVSIVVSGIQAWFSSSASVFSYTKNTTGQALWNTILVILVALLIGFPIALFTAIYLNEFAKNKKIKKIIYFFLDSLGATPSILFGMFGLLFFIYTLGWTSQGIKGFSLIAGSLTITIVIIPSFARTIQQALSEVPLDLRLNGLALGCTTSQVVRRIVIPTALSGIATSMVLAIGRILSETAPLYLTAGLTSASQSALINSGQTLTTRIYAQLTNTNISSGLNIMYESAFLTLILILFLIMVGYYIIPNWRKIKLEFTYLIERLRIKFMIIKKDYSGIY